MRKMPRFKLIAVLVVLCMFWGGLQAQAIPVENEDQKIEMSYETPQKIENGNVFWLVIQMILALALIIFLAWGMIRFFGRSMNTSFQGRWIKVIEQISLGTNRSISVIEIGGRSFLIGITDHSISLLTEIEDPDLIQEMVVTNLDQDNQVSLEPMMIWKQVKRRIMPVREEPGQDFAKTFDQRLKQMDTISERMKNIRGDKNRDNGEET